MQVLSFFHSATSTWSHLVQSAGQAAIIDPVLDYDYRSANTSIEFADRLLREISQQQWSLRFVWETHAHADHLSAAAYIKQKTGARIGVGAGIRQVQAHFKKVLNIDELDDAFDELYHDGDCVTLGNERVQCIAARGHTPDSMIYRVADVAFIGDTLFAPDVGSARCDFPGGSAADLWATAQTILQFPATTKLYLGHDYPTTQNGVTREPLAFVTVAEQRERNIHFRDGSEAQQYIALRQSRDATLSAPNLLWPALNCNIRGGLMPCAEANGIRYLKIPLNQISTDMV